ncbi:hypothetical protein BU23DRAFT_380697, partial [Bimuria novae-zelandiae CBS 107.79]
ILLLPKSHPNPSTWTALINKSKAFRLHSLLTSPQSFSSTYEREAAFSHSDWEARLKNPLAYTFVAKSTPTPTPSPSVPAPSTHGEHISSFLTSDWVGSAVLFGPKPTEYDTNSGSTALFDIYGLFVLPSAQGIGLGTALMEACTTHAAPLAAAMNVDKAVVRVSVTKGNERVLELYRRIGF